MKKILFLFLLLPALAFGQLVREDNPQKVICSFDVMTAHYGNITVNNDEVYLFMRSDNQFEKRYISIYLGNNKKQVLLTLEDLYNLKGDQLPDYGTTVKGYNTDTTLRKWGNSFSVTSKGIAGKAYFTNIKAFRKKISKSIIDYYDNQN